MKIGNLNRVARFRLFERWTPDPAFGGFSDVNIIYAGNGSGKSTFAEVLNPERSVDAWAAGVEVELTGPPGSPARSCRDASDPVWKKVALFNRDYVRASINFEAGTAKSVLALGRESADRKQRLAYTNAKIDELEAARPAALQNVRRSQQTAPGIATNTARVIHNALSSVAGYGRGYTASNVKAALDEAYSDKKRATLDPDALRDVATDRAPDLLRRLAAPERPSMTVAQVDALVAESPTPSTEDRILGSPTHLDWVKTGTELHDADDECMFCLGPVTAERLRDLADVIDASLDSLVGRVRGAQDDLRATLTALDEWNSGLPAAADLYADLQAEYVDALPALEASVGSLRKRIVEQSDRLNRKSLDPTFGQATAETSDSTVGADEADESARAGEGDGDGWPVVTLNGADSIIERHNVRAGDHDETSRAAARDFELYQIGAVRESYEVALRTHSDFDVALKTLDAELAKLRGDLVSLQNQSLDPGPPAELLNDQLHALLGRDEIRLEPAGDGEYTIARGGAPAQDLSEGERTALSLLHFLMSLRDRGASLSDQIVVIDDPVSSLDDGIAFGVFAAIWSALIVPEICGCGKDLPCGCDQKPTAECNQLFVLTHSFEFFRKWVNQLPQTIQKAGRNARFLELDTRYAAVSGGTARRTPTWIEWPERDLAMRMRSEYHYLFWRVGNALSPVGSSPTVEQLMDLEALLPNAARRLLESFLSFHLPGDIKKSLREQLGKVLKDVSDDPRRTRLHTFLNHFSHLEESGTVRALNRSEAPIVLRSVFELILDLDGKHFSRMCEALDLQPLDLVEHVLDSDPLDNATVANQHAEA